MVFITFGSNIWLSLRRSGKGRVGKECLAKILIRLHRALCSFHELQRDCFEEKVKVLIKMRMKAGSWHSKLIYTKSKICNYIFQRSLEDGGVVGGAGGHAGDDHPGGHGQPPGGRDGPEAAQPARRARAGDNSDSLLFIYRLD